MLPTFIKNSIPENLHLDWNLLEQAHEDPAVTSIRINPLKPTEQFNTEHKIPWCDNGFYLKERPNFTADPLLHAGCYYVQEASSMFLEVACKQLLSLEDNLRVIDLCAAPGGKSTHIVSLLSPESLLISNEVIPTRVNSLVENAVKWGYNNHWVSNSDPSYFGRIKNYADVLLIDAPCSGSGLFRKMPDYVNEITAADITNCAIRQKKIIQDSYDCLCANGILIYMTCSYSAQENEEIVDFLLKEFDVETCRLDIPSAWHIIETKSEYKQGYGYRFFPHLLQGEGFFLACFRKKDGDEKIVPSPSRIKKIPALPDVEGIDISKHTMLPVHDYWAMIRENHYDDLIKLQEGIKLVKKGTMLGQVIKNAWLPHHELAMSTEFKGFENSVEVTLAQAIAFLKKENILLPDAQKGWCLITYQHKPLGWVKNLGNRVNNYYPQAYRILNQRL